MNDNIEYTGVYGLNRTPELYPTGAVVLSFCDGMAKQCESSVDRAVNAISRPWVDLTTEEINAVYIAGRDNYFDDIDYADFFMIARTVEAKLKEKNHE